MNWNIFRGRRVLLTGHTGFKGGWLALWLERLGAQVYGYSLPPAEPSLYTDTGLAHRSAGRLADLRDRPALEAVLTEAQPEIVFHLAAQSLVRRSYREPLETFEVNILGTANLLNALRGMASVRSIVVVTSDKCYDNREWVWPYRENEALGGADPYSASKGCAEIVAASYRRSFFQNAGAPHLATCRAGNVFGGGDWAEDRLVPDIARAILGGRPVVLRHPESVRPWQHVLEPLRGYLMVAASLLGNGSAAQAWNFGPAADSEITVGELSRRMVEQWQSGEIVLAPELGAVHEARLLRLDSSKAASELGWRPVLSIDDGIRLTVDWYRAWGHNRADIQAVTQAQIDEYMTRCADRHA